MSQEWHDKCVIFFSIKNNWSWFEMKKEYSKSESVTMIIRLVNFRIVVFPVSDYINHAILPDFYHKNDILWTKLYTYIQRLFFSAFLYTRTWWIFMCCEKELWFEFHQLYHLPNKIYIENFSFFFRQAIFGVTLYTW